MGGGTAPAAWWTTACPDWERRIVAGESLIPCAPLFAAEAAAALEVFDNLRLVDVAGGPTMAEACRAWFRDFVGAIFGAYDAETGRRLINSFLLFIAKKNMKSTGAAAIMLTALIRNWRELGEYYILAPTKEVADNSFLPAAGMIAVDPALRALLHVKPNQRIIEHRTTGALLKVVAADSETVSGKKGIGILVDEVWLFGRRANAMAMLSEAIGGMASRPEGFVIYLSTQSDDAPKGVWADKLELFRAIRDGRVVDPTSLGVLYEFPAAMIKDGSYRRPENWRIPNPNLGASVDEAFIAKQLAEAERSGKDALAIVLAKHLNVQVDVALRIDGWAGALTWACGVETGLTLDAILDRSEVVTVGIDGGGLDDLLGIAVIGRCRETKRWLAWAHALISTIGVVRRRANAVDYAAFKAAGDLDVFRFAAGEGRNDDGAAEVLESEPAGSPLHALLAAPIEPDLVPQALPPDVQYVVDVVQRIHDRGLLAEVGVDAAGIGGIVDALASIGVTQDAEKLGAIRQGIALMGPIKTVERKLADGSFRHGGSRMLAWCAGNAKVVPTPTAMRIARDEAGFGKIDPLMALFNAAALMSLNPTVTPKLEVAAMIA